VIFSASYKAYGEAIVNLLDKEHLYIKERLFREHCYSTKENIFIKDLRIFKGVNLKDITIVDNSVYSYGFQLTNGVPILPYYNDKFDTELIELEKYLLSLVTSFDIRPRIEDSFCIEVFRQHYDNQLELIKQLFKAVC